MARELRTHCKQGHDLFVFGSPGKQGYLYCKECNRVRARGNCCRNGHTFSEDTVYFKGNGLRRMCKICFGDKCPNGHLRSDANSYINKKGSVECRACKVISNRRDKRLNPLRAKKLHIKNYGITYEEYLEILNKQEFKCSNPLCLADLSKCKSAIDHDHACCPGKRSCGKCIRGILCHNCNVSLGLLQDSVTRIHGLAEYLQSWNKFIAQATEEVFG